jgi:leader peptidase (prepilin peptidase)/N-methyltransferase
MLRGKCRYCKVKISGRYALVETICGLSYAGAFLASGLSIHLLFALVLFPILICLSFFDFDTGEIEYWCPISIGVLGLVMLSLSVSGIVSSPWTSHLIGIFIISVPFMVLAFFGAMGGADVQLMAAAGLLLGWSILPAAFIGIFLGAVAGTIIKFVIKPEPQKVYDEEDGGVEPKGTVLRFGPFLAVGIAVGFLYGEKMINWYLGFMGL